MLNPLEMAKKARELQKKMKKVQKELEKEVVEVKTESMRIVVNGVQEIVELDLNPSVREIENIKTFAEGLQKNLNKALSQSQDLSKGKMKSLTGGLNIPGLT